MNHSINIKYVPVADLIPYAANSRTHSDVQVTQIAASIREFGFTNPILVNAENTIIAGHGRLMELDSKHVDAIIKRWQDFTGKEAIHAETGLPFNEMTNDANS